MPRPIPRLAALAALLFAPTAIFALSSLVLSDGQVIKGSEVRRDGDSYYVTMTDGNTAVFPSALVKEIKFDDDGPTAAPPGFDYSGPRQLAGPVVPPSQDPSDQLKVLGPPTQWSKNAVDTSWTPTSAYDLNADVMAGSRSTWSKNAVDTTWVPTNAYDPNADVMAGSKSTWSKSAVDTEWKPQDGFGFKSLSFKGAAQQPPELSRRTPPHHRTRAAPRPRRRAPRLGPAPRPSSPRTPPSLRPTRTTGPRR